MCAIFLKHGKELVEMVEQGYEAESVLQQLLADYPNLLAGDADFEPRRRWLLVKRELGIASQEDGGNRWSIDHLFLDQDGVPTLVEVKRASDTRIRREVVGQLLDYAANASVSWGLAKIREAFESRLASPEEAEAVVDDFLGGYATPERFWESVGVNLKAGKLRLVFVADEIPSELKRVVEFLNEQMNRTEVLALEVRQYVEQVEAGDRRLTLVPRLIGETEAARQTKGTNPSRAKRNWGETDVLQALRDQHPPELAGRMINLYESLRDAGARRSWGTGEQPSVMMWLGEAADPTEANPVCVGIYTNWLAVNFHFVRDKRSPHEMVRLASLIREVPGARPHFEGLEERNYGSLGGMPPGDALDSDESLETFKRVVVEAAQRDPAQAARRG
jgi:hypothetical protein